MKGISFRIGPSYKALMQDVRLMPMILIASVSVYVGDDGSLGTWRSFLLFLLAFLMYEVRHMTLRDVRFGAGAALAAAVYAVTAYSDVVWMQDVAGFVAVMSFLGLLLGYYTRRSDPYVPYLVDRLRRTAVAAVYFVTVCIACGFVIFFSRVIFDVDIFYEEKFRLTLAFAFVAGLSAMFAEEPKPEVERGAFFKSFFGKIVPKLTLLVGVFALVATGQILFGFRPDVMLVATYYPYVVLFFTAYVLGDGTFSSKAERTLVSLVFIAMTFMVTAMTIKRMLTIPSQAVSAWYPLICNGLFLSYLVYQWKCREAIDVKFTQLVIAVGLVLTCPFIGYASYHEHVTYTGQSDETLVARYSIAEIFEKRKPGLAERERTYAAQKDRLEAIERAESADKLDNVDFGKYDWRRTGANPETIRIDTTGYAAIYLNNELAYDGLYGIDKNLPDMKVEGLRITTDSSFVELLVTDSAGRSERFPLYEDAEAASMKSRDERNALVYETDSYRLVVTGYRRNGLREKAYDASVEFYLMIKSPEI